ncbi:hypothetical protein BJ875DRAFT_443053 [Amylocarpus encephaloides]|uniref:DUF676 domain-containing protein n=1 Tax=Amylocarpus encephaloides TaxID=45428 RepID=A0A9P7YF80_9HELO|nr:hypothetical protein BJ875DRAFT_443053 [Amylocarpus encephaloides]
MLRNRGYGHNTSQPKIVFIAYSLGGYIVKKCLEILSEDVSRYGSIFNSITNIVFFASPHREDEAANHGLLAVRITKELEPQASWDFLVALGRSTKKFEDLNQRFLNIMGSQYNSIRIVNFYETIAPVLTPWVTFILNRHSATIGMSQESAIGLRADHRNICKFSDINDQNYRLVIIEIQRLLNGAKPLDYLPEQSNPRPTNNGILPYQYEPNPALGHPSIFSGSILDRPAIHPPKFQQEGNYYFTFGNTFDTTQPPPADEPKSTEASSGFKIASEMAERGIGLFQGLADLGKDWISEVKGKKDPSDAFISAQPRPEMRNSLKQRENIQTISPSQPRPERRNSLKQRENIQTISPSQPRPERRNSLKQRENIQTISPSQPRPERRNSLKQRENIQTIFPSQPRPERRNSLKQSAICPSQPQGFQLSPVSSSSTSLQPLTSHRSPSHWFTSQPPFTRKPTVHQNRPPRRSSSNPQLQYPQSQYPQSQYPQSQYPQPALVRPVTPPLQRRGRSPSQRYTTYLQDPLQTPTFGSRRTSMSSSLVRPPIAAPISSKNPKASYSRIRSTTRTFTTTLRSPSIGRNRGPRNS